jgi:hypothetical protein
MAETVVTEEQKLEAAHIEQVKEEDRTPAQKRIIQLVSRAKQAESEAVTLRAQYVETQAKLAAREKAEKDASDAAALASAKTKEDYEKLAKKIEAERVAEKADYDAKLAKSQEAILDRAGKMVLTSLAIKSGMINSEDIQLFKCEIEIDPQTLEVTPEGLKELNTEFEKFKKARPHLFKSGTPVKSPDGGPARLRSSAEKYEATQGKDMSPIEMIAVGLAQKASGR